MMLEQKVYENIVKSHLIENGDKIVLGVSGGPDSICMLDILGKMAKKGLLDFEIFVAHVNHGLRENAKLDEEFVKLFCKKMNIHCFVKHANIKEIAQSEKRGLEETGRKIRYDFFDEVEKKVGANKIAIAHNQNDLAETIIMNILRGTGIKGLIGIENKNGKYIRPLLEMQRFEIEEYLKEEKIEARYDESNEDNTFTRNKIRNVVLPYLEKEFNPSIVDVLERLSNLAKEQEKYLEKQTVYFYEQLCISERKGQQIILNIKEFNKQEKLMQKRIIFYSIEKLFGTSKGIEKVHMDDMIKLCNNNIGNKYLTPNKNLKVALEDKKLKITKIT